MGSVFAIIAKARYAHARDLSNCKLFSYSYYYAKTMIDRCDKAIASKDEHTAWKIMQG